MTYKVRRNATTDSQAFVAACEAFSSERHPVVRPSIRVQQPPGGVSTVEFGHHDVAQETEALMKSRTGSDSKKSEIYGSVFRRTDSGNGENKGTREAVMRIHQELQGFQEHHTKKKFSWLMGRSPHEPSRCYLKFLKASAGGFNQRSFQIAGEESAALDRLITVTQQQQGQRTSVKPPIRSTLYPP